jgi:uroporphyrinogen-III synthase
MSPDAGPLTGLRVAVTRPRKRAGELAQLLDNAGARAVLIPLTRILPPADEAGLLSAIARLERFDWVVFTSASAAGALAGSRHAWQGSRPKIGAVGTATAAAVHALTGREPDAVSVTAGGSGIVPAMLVHGSLHGMRVLWPRADQPRPELPRDLIRAGAVLEDPIAYRTVADSAAGRRLARLAEERWIDVITFTAPSAVACFADAAPGPLQCIIAVIGPSTAAAARTRGLPVQVESSQPVMSALVSALARYHTREAPRQT